MTPKRKDEISAVARGAIGWGGLASDVIRELLDALDEAENDADRLNDETLERSREIVRLRERNDELKQQRDRLAEARNAIR